MLPTTALARLAAIINASPLIGVGNGRLRGAHYPHEGLPQQLPALEIFWDETTVEHSSDFQLWHMTVRGQLLTALMADPPREVRNVDPVIAGLVDLFDARLHPANYRLETAADYQTAEHCSIVRLQPSAGIAYASPEPNFYGAELFWDVKLTRAAGDA